MSSLDDRISHAIQGFDGIPTATGLGQVMGLGRQAISRRLKANASLAEAMETRGRAWLEALPEERLKQKISEIGWISRLPAYAKGIVHARFDALILDEIRKSEGVPNAKDLGEVFGVDRNTISGRLEANHPLAKAMEQTGKAWLGRLLEGPFMQRFSQRGWVASLPDYAKESAYGRFDSIILGAIERFDGIPTENGLGRAIGVSGDTISSRLEANPSLPKAMERHGREYVRKLPEGLLKARIRDGWTRTLPDYANALVYERLDDLISREMRDSDVAPTARGLGKAVSVGRSAISHRLDANPELWLAFYARRGLSPDQAVELALERNEQTESATRALSARLRNLSAFREMVGLIRCFGDLLTASVAEVSLYPQPLARAAHELGVELDVHYVSMNAFRQGGKSSIPAADTVVLQSIHRLSIEALTTLFQELHRNYPYSKVIATFSAEHLCTNPFLDALGKNGYAVEESGIMHISPPDNEILRSSGVRQDDLSQVREKMSCQSQVLLLDMLPAAEAASIPKLQKISSPADEGVVSPDALPIDVPEGANRGISVKFVQSTSLLPSEPFVVDIEDNGKRVATVGYDMHPDRGNTLETDVYPGAPAGDYRRIARQIASDANLRTRIGVASGRIATVDRNMLRK